MSCATDSYVIRVTQYTLQWHIPNNSKFNKLCRIQYFPHRTDFKIAWSFERHTRGHSIHHYTARIDGDFSVWDFHRVPHANSFSWWERTRNYTKATKYSYLAFLLFRAYRTAYEIQTNKTYTAIKKIQMIILQWIQSYWVLILWYTHCIHTILLGWVSLDEVIRGGHIAFSTPMGSQIGCRSHTVGCFQQPLLSSSPGYHHLGSDKNCVRSHTIPYGNIQENQA